MTQALNDRRARYSATAGQTNFEGDFPIDSDADVQVWQKVNATGVVSLLTLTTDYTVTLDGAAPNTFEVDLVTGAAVGDIITVEGDTDPDRDTDFTTGGDYLATTVNNAEDRQYRVMQELVRDLDRAAIANPVSPSTFDPTLPDVVDEAGKYLRVNSGETALELAELVSTSATLSDATPGDTAAAGAAGSSSDISRADHVHAIPTSGVISAMINALAVTTGKIAALAVTTAKIAANAVDSTKLKAALIPDFTEAVITAADSILFSDADDSGNSKRDTVQGILDLVSAGVTLGTEQATTSGTTITFGSIPAGTKRITINLVGVSFTGTADMLIQIGDAGGIETTGYISGSHSLYAATNTNNNSTTGFITKDDVGATAVRHGRIVLELEDAANFTWVCTHNFYARTDCRVWGAGSKSLSAELTQLQLNGGTFDAGAVNITYE